MGGTLLALIQGIILLILAPFIGISLTVPSVCLVVVVLFVISFGLTALGFLIAWRMDSTQGFHAIMNLFLIPLWLLSGALFPPSGAAGWLGKVMLANPLSYGVSALRQGLYLDNGAASQDIASLAVSLSITIVFAATMFALSALAVRKTGVV
jgi:ABC-2 type transport system permease protein